MDRRGVELSMNVIIIAAIALIVLVVLVLLVTGAFGDIRGGTGCQSIHSGGSCENVDFTQGESCASVMQDDTKVSGGQTNCAKGQVCCYTPLQ